MNTPIIPKRYRLIKDTPTLKAGVIFTQEFDKKMLIGHEYQYVHSYIIGEGYSAGVRFQFYDSGVVEKQPEWFEEIKGDHHE